MNTTDSSTRLTAGLRTPPSTLGPSESSNALYHTRLSASPFAPQDSPHKYPFLSPAQGPEELGRLGHYRVLRTLGIGGMGYVFQAEDTVLGRPVALKVMKPGLDETGHPRLRFQQEARIMASLQHEHLVTVYHVGEENGAAYLAMELLQGETLDRWLHRVKRADAADVLRIGREIAAGLHTIHKNGLMHRDLKPSNLWLEAPCSRVKILDFGLARYVESDIRLTQSDRTVGTPGYLAPEQARGDAVDARGDLFSLGAVLYCLCTGNAPFEGSNTLAVLSALALDHPQPPHEVNPRLPRALSDYVMKLLAKDPADRPASAREVVETFRCYERGEFPLSETQLIPVASTVTASPRSKRLRLYMIGIVAAAVLGIAGALIVGWPFITPSSPVKAATTGVVYLSDLKPSEAINWIDRPPGPPPRGERDGPPRQGDDFRPPPFAGVRVDGQEFPHGLFTHPMPRRGPTKLNYRLDRQFTTFESRVSINDGPPGPAVSPVLFSVYGDGKLLWRGNEVRSQGDTQSCRVSIQGVAVLTLQVECGGDPRHAHAVWLDPRLAR
jgi:eukaryotic-like serine/threonine-protein kinase